MTYNLLALPTQISQEPSHTKVNIAQFGQELTDEDYEDTAYGKEPFTLYQDLEETLPTTTAPEEAIIIISAPKTPPHHCDKKE